MRHYPSDSPEAMGRLVALTLMADGAIDASELRQLDHTDTIRRLGLDEAGFDKVIHDLCNDMLTSAHRTPVGQLELDVDNIDLLLAEVQHPLLRKQVLRMMLDVVNADSRLSGGEAVLVAEAMKYWEIDLYEVADNAVPSLRVRTKARFAQAHA
ncbi:MAG: TerB family tellurite resistance protein [Dechloromonas sp.]|nr:TerB family tellurite resistance protein [Dechloromonas sp.]